MKRFNLPPPPNNPVEPYRFIINSHAVPEDMNIRTVPNQGVCDAFYALGTQPHAHHLQSAKDEVDMAVWGFNEQARYLRQEDINGDEFINRGNNNGERKR